MSPKAPFRVRQPQERQSRVASEVSQRIFNATVRCVERSGLNALTIDAVATESGVSRATIYRHYGNRETLLAKLVDVYYEPFEGDCLRILSSQKSFINRMQELFVVSVTEMNQVRWLKDMFRFGVSADNISLHDAMYHERVRTIMLPFLKQAQAHGELRENLNCEKVMDWFRREILFHVAMGPADRVGLIQEFRHFISPVLVPDSEFEANGKSRSDHRLTKLEEALDTVQQTLLRLEQQLSGFSSDAKKTRF